MTVTFLRQTVSSFFRALLPTFLLAISGSASGALFFDIKITHKKGIDEGLTLISELHSVEEMIMGRPVSLKMKNGMTLTLSSAFSQNLGSGYGPSSMVLIRGGIYGADGKKLKSLDEDNIAVELGSEHTISYDKYDQLIKIAILPHML